ncbi:hypothetical protein [Streptomyces sp. VRA16 Mangrove soil]|uniref:hypothetical protein n=1 Tax=Streptomyces sp. VRA16 Mangrove soil TaxID=2817434 RepID=UPI001A9E3E40|nr:hypothetical protein [Streptomyces sp. VRA16 Mangrove soil]MBO1335052.1 hypothetical protein [Streptomyces sp. VRA16 Mangrove soil]
MPAFVRAWGGAGRDDDWAGRVRSELALDLPDEDIGEDLDDCLDLYEMGSKPRCEEAEYLGLLQDARDRIAWGR